MTKLAIFSPGTLLGTELREKLEERPQLWDDLQLLTNDDQEIGTLTEVGGAAALIRRYEEGDLEGIDVVFFCGRVAKISPLLERLPATTSAVVLCPDAGSGAGRPAVAGLGAHRPQRGEVLLSPDPAAILASHLLAALAPFGIDRAAATFLLPASVYGRQGLDELLDQTRSILAFQSDHPKANFGRQLAFNLYRDQQREPTETTRQVQQVLDASYPLAAQMVQAGVFHSLAASLFVHLADDPGLAAVEEALGEGRAISRSREPASADAAASEEVLLGGVAAQEHDPGGYSVWAVMDNLTRGGALNAIELAEELLALPAG